MNGITPVLIDWLNAHCKIKDCFTLQESFLMQHNSNIQVIFLNKL